MDNIPSQITKPIANTSPKKKNRYIIGPRGWLFFFLAIIVLFLGLLGYLEYDRIVEPYFKEYICCLPAVLLAGLLFFLGFATRVTAVRQVRFQRPATIDQQQSVSNQRSQPKDLADKKGIDPTTSNDNTASSSNVGSNIAQNTTPSQSYGLRKYEPVGATKDELISQKRNLTQFLKNLDEQYKDGLLMDNVYLGLKNKYNRELVGLDNRLKIVNKNNSKKLKTLKTKSVKIEKK